MPDYYTCAPTSERFTRTTLDDALAEYLYDRFDNTPAPPGTIARVHKFSPVPITDHERKWAARDTIERLIEHLDEEHGDPDESTLITPTMRAAAQLFVDTVLAEYLVWSCEEVIDGEWPKDIDLATWQKEKALL